MALLTFSQMNRLFLGLQIGLRSPGSLLPRHPGIDREAISRYFRLLNRDQRVITLILYHPELDGMVKLRSLLLILGFFFSAAMWLLIVKMLHFSKLVPKIRCQSQYFLNPELIFLFSSVVLFVRHTLPYFKRN